MTASTRWMIRCSGWALLCFLAVVGVGAEKASEAERQNYAPSRQMEALHVALDVTPNFRERSLAGQMTLRFRPIAKPLRELVLDGVDLQVRSVTSTEKLRGWQATVRSVIVTFQPEVPAGKEATVTVSYTATPDRGLYFRTPELGYKAEDMHLFTQGEPLLSRHWFPCLDAPQTKATSELTCRLPPGMVALSNGRLISEEQDPATGLLVTRWLQDKPHSTYLIALAAGHFKKVDERYRDLPLSFYVPASEAAQAANSFAGTRDMLEFFERETGVPYPWAKYAQVCVDDFVAGGMENTSLTILHASTLHTADFENLHDSHGLVAHELAHQWFGDYVTCKDWANLWLNEGFATYYEQLYQGHRLGPDELLYRLYESAKGITAHANETNAIVRRDFKDPNEQFSYLAYPKGAWVLHMLRSQLGEELYRRCIQTWLQRHAFGTVVTEDLNRVVEELSGASFDRFFDQWVFHAGQPELNVEYRWDESTRLARLSIEQVQKVSDRSLLFQFSLPVRFKTKSGVVDQHLLVKEKSEDFYLALPAAPEIVRIDPELTVLAKLNFAPPKALLDAQLADASDMLGRLIAVEQLSGKREALGALQDRLNHDSYFGVRIAAAKGLRAIHSDEALDVLAASLPQADARVRQQVVTDIAGCYHEKAYAALLRVAQTERNPEIRAAVIRGLGVYARPEVHPALLELLRTASYHHVLADAAISAMRSQDDASFLSPILAALGSGSQAFPPASLERALGTLGWLARNEPKRDTVREFLLRQLNSKRESTRVAAISALGTLGDAKALAVLETFRSLPAEARERDAAEKAIGSLRDGRKPAVELGQLRSEVLDLQKANRELRKEIDALKKQQQASAVRAP